MVFQAFWRGGGGGRDTPVSTKVNRGTLFQQMGGGYPCFIQGGWRIPVSSRRVRGTTVSFCKQMADLSRVTALTGKQTRVYLSPCFMKWLPHPTSLLDEITTPPIAGLNSGIPYHNHVWLKHGYLYAPIWWNRVHLTWIMDVNLPIVMCA